MDPCTPGAPLALQRERWTVLVALQATAVALLRSHSLKSAV